MSEQKLALYGYFRSSTAYRARIALNLKKLDYEQVPVHLLRDGGEHRHASYQAITPQMRVPALAVGEAGVQRILIQSPAIIEWLDEMYPDPPLLPDDPYQRATARAIAAIIACDIHPLNNLSTLKYLETLRTSQEERDAWYAHWVTSGFAAIESLIESGRFCVGDAVSIADVYLVPQVFNARRFGVPLAAFPKIVAAADECSSLPAFREAEPANQPDSE